MTRATWGVGDGLDAGVNLWGQLATSQRVRQTPTPCLLYSTFVSPSSKSWRVWQPFVRSDGQTRCGQRRALAVASFNHAVVVAPHHTAPHVTPNRIFNS